MKQYRMAYTTQGTHSPQDCVTHSVIVACEDRAGAEAMSVALCLREGWQGGTLRITEHTHP
jgi:hypothetical protein